MKIYKSKYGKLPGGTKYAVVLKAARSEYRKLQSNSPRRLAYVKSRYFKGQKIFLDDFWLHLNQKPLPDRTRRLRFYLCAIDLLRNATEPPEIKYSTTKAGVKFYRFSGQSREGHEFQVQIRESKNGRKYFMSVFPD